MPDDDVLTRAKRSRERWIELRKTQMAGYPTEDLDAPIALAQRQAAQLAEIRAQHWPSPTRRPECDCYDGLTDCPTVAILDRKQP